MRSILDRRLALVKVNLGCGADIRKGWINCDKVDKPGINRVFDLTDMPMPFEDESVDIFLCSHVLEHILNYEDVIDDCVRALKPGGVLEIKVPYGTTYTPYHVRFFKRYTLDPYYKQQHYQICCQFSIRKPPFKLISLDLFFTFWLGWHLDHYLKIKFLNGKRYRYPPIGKPHEIVWELRKIAEPRREDHERMRHDI